MSRLTDMEHTQLQKYLNRSYDSSISVLPMQMPTSIPIQMPVLPSFSAPRFSLRDFSENQRNVWKCEEEEQHIILEKLCVKETEEREQAKENLLKSKEVVCEEHLNFILINSKTTYEQPKRKGLLRVAQAINMLHSKENQALFAKADELTARFDSVSGLSAALELLKKLTSLLMYSYAEKKLIYYFVTGEYSSLIQMLLKPPKTTSDQQTKAEAKAIAQLTLSPALSIEDALNAVISLLGHVVADEEHRLSRETLETYEADWREVQNKRNPPAQKAEIELGVKALHEEWRLARLERLEELGLDAAAFYTPLSSLLPLTSSANTAAAERLIADYVAGVVDSEAEFKKQIDLIDPSILNFWSPAAKTLFCTVAKRLVENSKKLLRLRLNVELIRRDMERKPLQLQALVTGKSELIAKHKEQLDGMLKPAGDSSGTDAASSNECLTIPQLIVIRYDSAKPVRIAVHFWTGAASSDNLKRVIQLLSLSSERNGSLWSPPPQSISLKDLFLENLEHLSALRVRVILVGESGADAPVRRKNAKEKAPSATVDLSNIGLSDLKRGNRAESNCIYSRDGSRTSPGFKRVADFSKAVGGEKYHAPLGWHRWGLDLGLNSKEFEQKYKDWPVAFHGTKHSVVNAILERGLRMSTDAKTSCYLEDLGWDGCVYVSPSIVYVAHPRYAEPVEQGNQWVQVSAELLVDCIVQYSMLCICLPYLQFR